MSDSGIIPWPRSAPKYHNGTNVPCEAWVGPCSCGAWHMLGEFEMRGGELYRYNECVSPKRKATP